MIFSLFTKANEMSRLFSLYGYLLQIDTKQRKTFHACVSIYQSEMLFARSTSFIYGRVMTASQSFTVKKVAVLNRSRTGVQ